MISLLEHYLTQKEQYLGFVTKQKLYILILEILQENFYRPSRRYILLKVVQVL